MRVLTQHLSRQNSFDVVRLIAALSVFLAHQFSLAGEYLPGYQPPRLGPWGPKLADAGLYVFFTLSGYLVYNSLERDARARRFFQARFLRIYPAAIVNTVLCILFAGMISLLNWREFWLSDQTADFFLHNSAILLTPTEFQLPGFLPQAKFPLVNIPIWTLKYELAAYIALFIVFQASRWFAWTRTLPLLLLLVCSAAGFYVMRLVPASGADGLDELGKFQLIHALRFAMVFSLGAAYASLEPIQIWKSAIVAGALLACAAFAPGEELARIFFIGIIAVAAIEVGKSSLLYFERYARIGDLSYGAYLYAFPIQIYTVTHFLSASNFWLLTAVDLALVLGLAFASWRLIEKPALAMKIAHRRNVGETRPN